MKKSILFFFLCISFLGISQTQNPTQNSSVVSFQKAEFPGGENSYKNELFKMIHGYIDMSKYAVNGVLSFLLILM